MTSETKKNYVITHIKADFDAIASAWAVMRLHKCDGILISTDTESNVKSFLGKYFPNQMPEEIRRLKPKDVESLNGIGTVYVTDCIQSKRLGALEPLLEKADEVVVYDHHPVANKDIKSTDDIIKYYGSCVTVVMEKLFLSQKENVTAFDATLYLLGIYEDTGMMTFSNTTPEDVLTVAELMKLGGDVTVTKDYVKHELNRKQVLILNELLINMVTMVVSGVNVSFSYASIDEFVPEMATLAQTMMEMENLEVLFILVRCGGSIIAVGRSTNILVDAGKILSRFNGGGHQAAASAHIKDLELHEALDALKLAIREQVRPVRFLRELMNSPAKSLEATATFKDALDFTLMHNLNHMPITSSGETVGILSRKDILQGIKHGLSDESISLLMQVEFQTFSPDTPFVEAEYAMVVNNQKLLPIEEEGQLVGVVTRTDLIRLMYEESVQRSSYEEGAKTRLGLSKNRCLADTLKNDLPALKYKYLMDVSRIANEENTSVYVVGGFVRDLLMGFTNYDIDIVVEGNAIAFAMTYARLNSAKITVHDRYKTATVIFENGDKIDFATARTEYYVNPGAMPSVESSSLRNDLMRRDFTINAMAIRIDGENFGQLVDFFSGQRDILDKRIRVLHSLSFVDDPTRAFRAVRFAARFNFELGTHTERLLKHAENMGVFKRINGGKLFIELKYILNEPKYLQSVLMLKKYHLLRFIAINLSINSNREEQFLFLEEFYESSASYIDKAELWQVRFVILLNDYIYPDFKAVLAKLHVQEVMAKTLLDIFTKSKFQVKKIKSMKAPKPSEIYKVLSELNNEELLMLAVLLGEKRSYIVFEYFQSLKHIKVELNGNDLVNLGLRPSKELGDLLRELLYARLDGLINTKQEEIEYVLSRI